MVMVEAAAMQVLLVDLELKVVEEVEVDMILLLIL
jgi:hypothetical protein